MPPLVIDILLIDDKRNTNDIQTKIKHELKTHGLPVDVDFCCAANFLTDDLSKVDLIKLVDHLQIKLKSKSYDVIACDFNFGNNVNCYGVLETFSNYASSSALIIYSSNIDSIPDFIINNAIEENKTKVSKLLRTKIDALVSRDTFYEEINTSIQARYFDIVLRKFVRNNPKLILSVPDKRFNSKELSEVYALICSDKDSLNRFKYIVAEAGLATMIDIGSFLNE